MPCDKRKRKYRFTLTKFGGAGSGHHGHEGREGVQGGSEPGEGGESNARFGEGVLSGMASIFIMDRLYQIGKNPMMRRRLLRRVLQVTKKVPLRSSVVLGALILGVEVFDSIKDHLREKAAKMAEVVIPMGVPVVSKQKGGLIVATSLGTGEFVVLTPGKHRIVKLNTVSPIGPAVTATVEGKAYPFIPTGKDKKTDAAYKALLKEGIEEGKIIAKEAELLNSNFKG